MTKTISILDSLKKYGVAKEEKKITITEIINTQGLQ